MARSNGSAALAGLLICFASLVASVNSAGVSFADIVGSGDTVTAYVPQQVSTPSPTTSPPATPPSPPATPPSPLATPPSYPTASPSAGAGTCTTNYSVTFWDLFDITTDTQHVIVSADGDSAEMRLDQIAAAAFGSKYDYYTGRFSAFLKLPCGNSSGTVFAFYTSSNGSMPDHDEIDIEILGNQTDSTYTMQTNIFVNGTGNREMRHLLEWFNPCEDYHEYFIQWNSELTMIGVDDSVLRVFYKNPAWPYFNKGQAMWVTYWDGSSWATMGGTIKIDFESNGPFITSMNGFNNIEGCQVAYERDVTPCLGVPHCWDTQESLTPAQQQDLEEKYADYCSYDYCQDYQRFAATGFPADCQK